MTFIWRISPVKHVSLYFSTWFHHCLMSHMVIFTWTVSVNIGIVPVKIHLFSFIFPDFPNEIVKFLSSEASLYCLLSCFRLWEGRQCCHQLKSWHTYTKVSSMSPYWAAAQQDILFLTVAQCPLTSLSLSLPPPTLFALQKAPFSFQLL